MIPIRLAAGIAASLVFCAHANEWDCGGALRAAAPIDSPEYRKYAPERLVDILHLAIDVTPDFMQRSISAVTKIRFKPRRPGVAELKLNAEDLRVREVTSTARLKAHHSTASELIVHFAGELPTEQEQEIAIHYVAFPKSGLYFRTAEMGYPPENEHLFTQGEDIEARHWFPCFDAPNEKFSSEVICRVPEAMTVLSNGKLISEQPLPNGMKAVHWRQEKPHVTYLISLVAGYFKRVEDRYKDIPLAFYTPVSLFDLARNSFQETKEMMAFFENEIGVPYPWDKYYQVCVHDFVAGGMENTSITTLTDLTLFPAETENIRSSQGLVAHELAHQWFGDLVTCEDWSHIWLNEGFATYYAHLYNQHKDGQDDFLYGMYNSARGFIQRNSTDDSRPIVFRKYDRPMELFGYLVYPKGGWVLHMLRHDLGPDLYRKCIRTYLERHQYGSVITQDLISVIEEVSGRSFDAFFDQWVFHPHHPEIRATYSWDEKTMQAKISIAQTQQLTNEIALFHFPLEVRFKGSFGTIDKVLPIQQKQEDFFIPLPAAPEIVRLDPGYVLLARIQFELPRKLLVAQLEDESDVMGRIFALEQLSKSKDAATVQLIAGRLSKDPFYGVRLEAAQALRTIHTPEALAALLAASKQDDARVRQKVALEIGNFFDASALEFALRSARDEKNPDIKRHAVAALGAYPLDKTEQAIREALESESFRDLVADGAISAIRGQGDPRFIPGIIQVLESRRLAPRDYGDALQTLASLARNQTNREPAYPFILKHANDPRRQVRLAALSALGALRDDRAIPVLSRFASGSADAPETAAANRALETLRGNRPAPVELQTLRGEVLDLKKQNDELKKSLDELKKRFDASFTNPAAPAARSSGAKPRIPARGKR